MELKDAVIGQLTALAAYNWLYEVVAGATVDVPVELVKSWALQQPDLIYTLKGIAAGATATAPLADTILEAIGINMPPWRMYSPSNVGLMDLAVAAAIITPAQKLELQALGDTVIYRWQSLGIQSSPKLWQIEELYP